MTHSLKPLLEHYRRSDIIVDSNLLLLLLIGTYDQAQITQFKRTAIFTANDYRALLSLLAQFRSVCTTPHVLAEVSNLANGLPAELRYKVMIAFAELIKTFTEQFIPAVKLAPQSEFVLFGITDCGLAEISGETLVLTTDGRLAAYLQQQGKKALNFHHLRPYFLDKELEGFA
jgi:hypothetical protein